MQSPTVVLAWDASGSTDGREIYHRQAKQVLETVQATIYLKWGSSCVESSYDELHEFAEKQQCDSYLHRCSKPEAVVKWCRDHVDGCFDLHLITDGEIFNKTITKCRKRCLYVGERLTNVYFYAFDDEPSYSVYLPFAHLPGTCQLNDQVYHDVFDWTNDLFDSVVSSHLFTLNWEGVEFVQKLYKKLIVTKKIEIYDDNIETLSDACDLFAALANNDGVDIVLPEENNYKIKKLEQFFRSFFNKCKKHGLKVEDVYKECEWVDCPNQYEYLGLILQPVDWNKFTSKEFKQIVKNPLWLTKTKTRLGFLSYGWGVVPDAKFDAYNDSLVNQDLFDGNVVGVNFGLLYWVLANEVMRDTYYDDFYDWSQRREYRDMFLKYAVYRIKKERCFITFDEYIYRPQIIVSTMFALWYCSTLSTGIMQNEHQDTAPIYDEMVKILAWSNFEVKDYSKRMRLITKWQELKQIGGKRAQAQKVASMIFDRVTIDWKNWLLTTSVRWDADYDWLKVWKYSNSFKYFYEIHVGTVLNELVYCLYQDDVLLEIDQNTGYPERGEFSWKNAMLRDSKLAEIEIENGKDMAIVKMTTTKTFEQARVASLYHWYNLCKEQLNRVPSLNEYWTFVCKQQWAGDRVKLFQPNIIDWVKLIYCQYVNP